MKKILYILITVLAFNLSSCDDGPERVIYSGDASSERTFLSLDKSSYDLKIAINDVGETEVILFSSTASSQDRTYTVNLDAEATTADTDAFTIPSSITIPANSYKGSMLINGEDITAGDVDETVYQIVFTLSDLSVVDMDIKATYEENGETKYYDYSDPIIVNMIEVCPVDINKFVGDYLLEQTTPEIDGPTLSDGQVLTISASDATTRSFTTQTYPNYCGTYNKVFTFSLTCGKIIIPSQDTTCSCSNQTDWFTAAINPESFDANDDSVFYITFTDDAQSDCSSPAQTTYKFTKQ